MKFTDKYPKALVGDTTEENMILKNHTGLCYSCGENTPWFEVDFHAPICSEECLDLMSIKWINEMDED